MNGEITDFETAAGKDALKASQLVNYIWINDDYKHPEESIFGVPVHSIDMALQNALRYPEADFNIWIEFSGLSDDDLERIAQNPNQFGANIRIRNIEEIDDFNENELTEAYPGSHIGVRSDMARLQVLAQCSEEDGYTDIFYSDFDCPDVKVNDPTLTELLEKHGAAIGMYTDPETQSSGYENGYMVFRRGQGETFLKETVIPETEEDMLGDGAEYNTGEQAIIAAFVELKVQSKADYHIGIHVLDICGTDQPKTQEAICAWKPAKANI